MGAFSIWHWLIVLLVVVLVFGTKKLRNVGSDVGGAVKSFKDAVNEESDEAKAIEETAETQAQKTANTIDQTVEK